MRTTGLRTSGLCSAFVVLAAGLLLSASAGSAVAAKAKRAPGLPPAPVELSDRACPEWGRAGKRTCVGYIWARRFDFRLSPHIVRVGERITATVIDSQKDAPDPNFRHHWRWGTPPEGGELVSCRPRPGVWSLGPPEGRGGTCTWKMTKPVKQWQAASAIVEALGQNFPAEDYYAVIEDEYALSGHVRDLAGKGIEGVRIRITERKKPFRTTTTTTDSGGFYSAFLPKGSYNVHAFGTGALARLQLCAKVVRGAGRECDAAPQVELTSSEEVDFANYLRYLAINVGNVDPRCTSVEYKLCLPQDARDVWRYIRDWRPDVIVMSEVARETQLNSPILPPGWRGICGKSVDRRSGAPAAWNAANASHEHECVAWKTSRVSLVEGSAASAYGRNDQYGQSGALGPTCGYDFTGFRVRLRLDGFSTITAVAIHPDSKNKDCRTEEISRYWTKLADGSLTLIGGDWNTDSDAELQRPGSFIVNFSHGQYWNLFTDHKHYSATYLAGGLKRHLDHAFTNFGGPCTYCGRPYRTENLIHGAALGGYEGHPRADDGKGMDHRQILVDVTSP